MDFVLQEAARLLESGQSFAYASILSQDGSTPRGVGSKMLILPQRIVGTIGGGGMEGDVMRRARERVLLRRLPIVCRYDLSAAQAANADFICGGSCEILIAYIDAQDANHREVFRAAQAAQAQGKRAWLFYVVDERPGAEHPFQICLNLAGERLVGAFVGNEKFGREMIDSPVRVAIHGDAVEGVRYFVDALHSAGRMLLFGGGHVSQAVAKLAVGLEFHVEVVDDRAEFANAQRFPGCAIHVIEDFSCLPDFSVDENTYLLILTRGHAHDATVLEWALARRPRYLGMIGSVSKRDTIYTNLRAKGFAPQKLSAVKCPIGLSIGAQTPAEIAVSILAEVIKHKYAEGGHGE